MSSLVLIAAAFVGGGWILRAFGLHGRDGTLAIRFCAGFCLCAPIVLALGSFSLNWAQSSLFVIAAIGLGFELFRSSSASQSAGDPRSVAPVDFIEKASFAAVTCALALALLGALAPVTSWDACVAHLALAKDYVREGRIVLFEGNDYSGYPQFMHALFAIVYLHGGETAASGLSWFFALLACMAIYRLGTQMEGSRCGWIAAAILATAPIFFDQAQAPMLDLAFCGLTVAALSCMSFWRTEKNLAWLAMAALLAGGSCGVRHTGYLICVFLALGALGGAREKRLRNFFIFSSVALIAALPWLLRSALLTGNPVFPFLTSLFGSGPIPHRNISALGTHESIRGSGLVQFLRFPWDIVMRPNLFDGWTKSPGGLVLILGIPGLIVGGKKARRLGAFALAGGIAFYFFERYARYLLPFFAPMMVVAAIAACRIRALRIGIAAVLIACFAYGLALDASAIAFKLPVLMGRETREHYFTRRVERYPAFDWINKNIKPSETIFTFDPRSYYLAGRSYQNDFPFQTLRHESLERQAAWFHQHHIFWLLIPVTYIEESGGYHDMFLGMVNQWRAAPQFFVLSKAFDLPRPRGGAERVEVYRVLQEQ